MGIAKPRVIASGHDQIAWQRAGIEGLQLSHFLSWQATSSLSVETQKPVSVDTKDPSSTHKTMPPLSKPKSERSKEERSREDRMREMREKREQQRLKKMAHTKLGELLLPKWPSHANCVVLSFRASN